MMEPSAWTVPRASTVLDDLQVPKSLLAKGSGRLTILLRGRRSAITAPPWMGRRSGRLAHQLTCHDHDSGPQHHRLVVLGSALIVTNQTTMTHQPPERPLDHPATGQHHEPADVVVALNDGDTQIQHRAGPDHQPAGVPAIAPDQRDCGETLAQQRQQRAGAVTVLHTRRGDHHSQQPPTGINRDVSLSSVDLLAVMAAPP